MTDNNDDFAAEPETPEGDSPARGHGQFDVAPPPAPKAPSVPPPFLGDVVSPPMFAPSLIDVYEPATVRPSDYTHLLSEQELPPRRRRRVMLPVMLFIATCMSTFWVGVTKWQPLAPPFDAPWRGMILRNWEIGLTYSACVLGILFTHEMGHFLATIRYRIPASLPFFLPVPITPIGTMGAVIGMDGLRANRRQLFDIGIAGPLAGLVLAIPITWIGVQQLDFTQSGGGNMAFDLPILVQWMLEYSGVPGYQPGDYINVRQLNPFFMAGWVGLLITGLNMMPISQLDGGHIVYTLFGKRAHWIARIFLFTAIFFVVTNWEKAAPWTLMLVLIILMGADHPPTSNDSMPLGWPRRLLGYTSLIIPILCFPKYCMIPL